MFLENFGQNTGRPAFRASKAPQRPRERSATRVPEYAMRFDLELFVSALCCMAEAAIETFRSKLKALFPGARVICDVNEMRGDEEACLMISDVKNPARICEKIREAAEEHGHDVGRWPVRRAPPAPFALP